MSAAKLFILGKGRSGSTVLDTLLGQLDGFVSVGELVYFWDRSVRQRYQCGCGRPVPDCEFWQAVLAEAFDARFGDDGVWLRLPDTDGIREVFGAREPVPAREVARLERPVTAWRNAPRLLVHAITGRGRWPALAAYCDVTARLYAAITEVSGSSVVVDSSKLPINPAALGLVDGAAASCVHLVRDPRAVAFSWQRHKTWVIDDRPEAMPRFGGASSSASWMARNLVAELARVCAGGGRSMRLRYEDFVAAPVQSVRSIAALAGVSAGELEFMDDQYAAVRGNHTAGGNPGRFEQGRVEFRADDEWVANIPGRDALLVTALTAPLVARYGYPLRVGPLASRRAGPRR